MNTAVDVLKDFRGEVTQARNVHRRKKVLASKPYFARELTPYPKTDFHKRWSRFEESNRFSLVLGPRGSAKTLQCTVNDACLEHLEDRNLRRLLIAETEFMSTRIMRDIKATLASDPIKEIFGDVRGDKWTEKEVTLDGRTMRHKEASITALSYGGAVASGRYDVIDMDDIATEETSRTKLQRNKMRDWLRYTLLPTLTPGGRVNVRATRYHFDDIYQFMIENGFEVYITPAINKNNESFWPEMFSMDELKKIRKRIGPVAWGAQYMNDVQAMKGSIIKADWIKRYKKLPEGLRRYQGYDLAISEGELADFFAGVTLAEDPRAKLIYVLGEYKDRLSFQKQFEKIVELYKYYDTSRTPVLRVGVESNQYQAALARHLKAESYVPVKAVHHHKDKITRALRIQPHFENGKILFPMEGTEELEEQLLRLGPDMKDAGDIDVADAFMTACEIAGYGGRKKARIRALPQGF
jgi:predicted phage terminase large subunit-like protein